MEFQDAKSRDKGVNFDGGAIDGSCIRRCFMTEVQNARVCDQRVVFWLKDIAHVQDSTGYLPGNFVV